MINTQTYLSGNNWDANYTPMPNELFYNNQNNDFTFRRVCYTCRQDPRSGSQFIDFDNDGDLDLYVTNYNDTEDEFYRNDNGVFTNIISLKGIDQNNDPDMQKNHDNGTGVKLVRL